MVAVLKRFVVQSAVHSHHRGPQHGVFSSSPFWFSVFTDSVSLAGTLAGAANKADIYKKIIICTWFFRWNTVQCIPGGTSVKRNKIETSCSTSGNSDSHFFITKKNDIISKDKKGLHSKNYIQVHHNYLIVILKEENDCIFHLQSHVAATKLWTSQKGRS